MHPRAFTLSTTITPQIKSRQPMSRLHSLAGLKSTNEIRTKLPTQKKKKKKSSVISEDYAASLAKPYMGECDTSSPTRDDHCDSPPSLSPELAV